MERRTAYDIAGEISAHYPWSITSVLPLVQRAGGDEALVYAALDEALRLAPGTLGGLMIAARFVDAHRGIDPAVRL